MNSDLYYRVAVAAANARYDLSREVVTVTVEEGGGGAGKLTFEIADPFKVLSHAIREGMVVETELGTVSDHSLVFRGRICKVEESFSRQQGATLRVVAFDKSMDMGLRSRNRVWTDLSLEELVQGVARDYFAPADVKADLKGNPSFTGNGIRQQDETDLAFLLRLAARYGCELFVIACDDKDELHFKAQYRIMKEEPKVTLYHGRSGVADSLLTFHAEVDAAKIMLPRLYTGIDYDSGEAVEQARAELEQVGSLDDSCLDGNLARFRSSHPERARSLSGLMVAAAALEASFRKELGDAEREVAAGFVTPDELKKRSENQFSTGINGQRGWGVTSGNHRIHAQATIGIGDSGRFSGVWYLSRVRHLLDPGGYRTEFDCLR